MQKILHLDVAPRAIIALGEDLVRDDASAIEELVKNSYDADARSVAVLLEVDSDGAASAIHVIDDGTGMTLPDIEHRWLVVAASGKRTQPKSSRGRIVTGEKGIGRLATARLGAKLEMATRTRNGTSLMLALNWAELAIVEKLGDFAITVTDNRSAVERLLGKPHGTALRISSLARHWQVSPEGGADLDELEMALGRVMNPFARKAGMKLFVGAIGGMTTERELSTSSFLDEPHYRLVGSVDEEGTLTATYTGPKGVDKEVENGIDTVPVKLCGPFRFELRAWDRDSEVLQRTTETTGLSLTEARELLDRQTGYFVYRDEFLVMPKKDDDRDWLALDRRRVNNPSQSLGVKNLLAAAFISRENNPNLRDKTDRGGLVDNAATREFRSALMAVLNALEMERTRDKPLMGTARAEPHKSLQISELVQQAEQLEKGEITSKQFRDKVEREAKRISELRDEITGRLSTIGRLATAGQLAGVLVHEIARGMPIIGDGLQRAAKALSEAPKAGEAVTRAQDALRALQRVIQRFAPYFVGGVRTRRRSSDLLQTVNLAIDTRREDTSRAKIAVDVRIPKDIVLQVDPGDLLAVVTNVLDNAIFWTAKENSPERRIDISARRSGDRANLTISDTGPGIEDALVERVFEPGFTSKRHGMGLGLAIARDIVTANRGQIDLKGHGLLGGAVFVISIPLEG